MDPSDRNAGTIHGAYPEDGDALADLRNAVDLELSSLSRMENPALWSDLDALRGALKTQAAVDANEVLGQVFDLMSASLARSSATIGEIVDDGRAFHAAFNRSSAELDRLNRRIDDALRALTG